MQTGKAYALDLRERVIAVYQEGKSTMEEVAKRFAVSRSWVNNLVQRQKQTGRVAAKSHGGVAVAKVNATHYPIHDLSSLTENRINSKKNFSCR